MRSLSKSLILLLIVLLATPSLSLIKPISAQSTPKPSVPEFSLAIVARPFDVAPSTTVNPYTGQTAITSQGYHVQNISIDITIRNEPSVTFYQVQFKGNYGDNWVIFSDTNRITPIQLGEYHPQSNSDYTVISIPINSDQPLRPSGEQVGSITNFPAGVQINFQVRALMGQPEVKQAGLMGDMVFFNGITGDWSNTQTITTPYSAASTTPDSTVPNSPTAPSSNYSNQTTQIVIAISSDSIFLLAGIVTAIVAAVVTGVILVNRHRKSP